MGEMKENAPVGFGGLQLGSGAVVCRAGGGQAVQPELGLLRSLAGPRPFILTERWRKIARLASKLRRVLSGTLALGSPSQGKVLNASEDRRHFANADSACLILQKPTMTQRTLEVTSSSLLGHRLWEYNPSSWQGPGAGDWGGWRHVPLVL